MVKTLFVPQLTDTAPDGLIEPPVLALAVIVFESSAKLAAMVWLAVTLLRV